MIKSRICDLLNIKYPIFQGGMAWVSESTLASAVSQAGGLGIISSINAGADVVRDEIRKCKSSTNKPFGVNVMLMSPIADQIAQMVIEEKVPVVTTGAGMPTKYMKEWLEAGIKVIPVVASTAIAIRMERMGACAVVAEGGESGGHIGEMNTMALVPQVCDAVQIPVIAAGGIADGRGLAAALMLGAEGVQCGTRFLSAEECQIHEIYKKKILAAGDTDTIVTGKSLGHPVRSLKTPFSRKFAEMEKDPAQTSESIMEFGTGSLRKAVKEGDEKMGSYMAGQSAGMVKQIEPTVQIIESMISEAENLLKGTNKWV
ncbi:MAG: enoyl-[acyl-carrier-protein] reductase FabK [Bacteroidales bacterium]|nr:enoyl-[acyl-carrier-protein] reductase FabK [Bacteroidales bacterium]MDD4670263.1 enoyl-[acyl-carrier-protein] reductase FabK [Bacteroidales bacterium]